MSKRTVPDLKELFKQASEIAQQVPESMQEAAFNRALEFLTGETPSEPTAERTVQQRKGKKKPPASIKAIVDKSSVDELISVIDSTQHPGVTSATTILDRSLMVLQIALTDHSIDGLTPSEIARILTEKFRISTRSGSVSMALGEATALVNRIPQGQGFSYKIMAPGEEYLAHLGQAECSPAVPTKRRKPRKKRVAKKSSNEPPAQDNGSGKKTHQAKQQREKPAKDTSRKTSQKSSAGPKAAVLSLINSGFFSQGRTAPEVHAHLKNKRGFNFGIDQLRLAMLRLVRDEKLDRDENAEGLYEYRRSKY